MPVTMSDNVMMRHGLFASLPFRTFIQVAAKGCLWCSHLWSRRPREGWFLLRMMTYDTVIVVYRIPHRYIYIYTHSCPTHLSRAITCHHHTIYIYNIYYIDMISHAKHKYSKFKTLGIANSMRPAPTSLLLFAPAKQSI